MRLQPRHGTAVVVGAEREQRQDERDLRQQEQPVRRVPEATPRAELLVAVDDSRHEQRGDRPDRDTREARHRNRRERPPPSACRRERDDEEGEPTGPDGAAGDVDDVGDEREPAADPGVARERRRGHEQRRRNEQRRRGHAAERKRGDEETRAVPVRARPARTASRGPPERSPSSPPRRGRTRPRPHPGGRSRAERRTASATPATASTRRSSGCGPCRIVASATAPPTTRKSATKSRKRTNVKSTLTFRGVPSPSTWAAIPDGFAPGAWTWKTNAPDTGCASADVARHVTVYVPRARRRSSDAAIVRSSGRSTSPRSTRRACES